MFEFLTGLARRLMARGWSLPPDPPSDPDDPFARVRGPRRPRPDGRLAAAAVVEPDDVAVDAIARWSPRP
jgi:hypothetical protein